MVWNPSCNVLHCLKHLDVRRRKWKLKWWSIISYSSFDFDPKWLQHIAKTKNWPCCSNTFGEGPCQLRYCVYRTALDLYTKLFLWVTPKIVVCSHHRPFRVSGGMCGREKKKKERDRENGSVKSQFMFANELQWKKVYILLLMKDFFLFRFKWNILWPDGSHLGSLLNLLLKFYRFLHNNTLKLLRCQSKYHEV